MINTSIEMLGRVSASVESEVYCSVAVVSMLGDVESDARVLMHQSSFSLDID